MSNTDTITIDLGDLGPRVRERVESGEYSSPSEVIRAGLEALAREEADFDDYLREKVEKALNDPRPDVPMEEVFERMRRKIQEAYDDPRPSVPAEDVFERLRARHAGREKARGS